MKKAMNKVQKARLMTGMSQVQVARLLGRSTPYWVKREQNPQLMTLGEFRILYRVCGEEERSLLDDYLSEIAAAG